MNEVELERKVASVLKRYRLKVNERTLGRFLTAIRPLVDVVNDELLELLVLDNLTIGESYFFRDRKVFAYLRKTLRERNFWNILSVGCSKGEEVYSLAILATEAGVNYKILGVDISPQRISEATKACYDFWSLRFLEDRELKKYFEAVQKRFCVREVYRKNVQFMAGDFLKIDFSNYQPFDLIFARRVILYAEDERKFVEKLWEILDDRGLLVTGVGEYFPTLYKFFEPVSGVAGVYRKAHKKEETNLQNFETAGNPRAFGSVVKEADSPLRKGDRLSAIVTELSTEEEIKLVEAWIKNGEHALAHERLKKLVLKSPTEYLVWKYKTLAELELGLLGEADKSLRKALFLNSNDEEVWQLKYMLDLKKSRGGGS